MVVIEIDQGSNAAAKFVHTFILLDQIEFIN